MCGRARCTLRPDDFPRACHLNARSVRRLDMDRFRPSYNVAPGFNVPVVRREEEGDGNGDGVVLHCMKWGLVPSFTKKSEKPDHFRMFNARSESIREKASFRRLLPKNRCLVSVEGFFEWKKEGSRKQPYYIHFKDGRPLVFAALFDYWKNSEGETLYTFTIITTSSSSSLEWLHDRMPVVLGNKESIDSWLNDSSLSNLDEILKPYEDTNLAWYPVTTAMGKLSFDGPECIKEVQVKMEETKSISQFFSKKEAHAPPERKLGTTMKEEPGKANELASIKEEDEGIFTLEKPAMNNQLLENHKQISLKEEPGRQDKYYQLISEKQEGDNRSNVSSPSSEGTVVKEEKRDYEESSADRGKPLGKATDKHRISPVAKRRKGADDKQPTLFSYFGRR